MTHRPAYQEIFSWMEMSLHQARDNKSLLAIHANRSRQSSPEMLQASASAITSFITQSGIKLSQ